MSIVESLKNRRSIYAINDEVSMSWDELHALVNEVTALVPDAFNSQASRVVLVGTDEHRKLWDAAYEVFGGKVERAKFDSFAAGAGTLLYFVDTTTVHGLEEQFPSYADRFHGWALQANAMLQLSIWTALSDRGIGASLQHYNPVIDDQVKKLLDLPSEWELVAQMPFGGIVSTPDQKELMDIQSRVIVR